jgi:hypothetical protein
VAVPADDDGRHGHGDPFQVGPCRERGDENDTVHAAVDHGFDDLHLRLLVVAARGVQELVVGVA